MGLSQKQQIISTSFEKNDDYSKTEKENEIRRHCFRGKLSDNYNLENFQPNGFKGSRLKNVRLTFLTFSFGENKKNIFFAASYP